jgi:NADPH:quinone reductase-like Zn-dependent oxidoreductase
VWAVDNAAKLDLLRRLGADRVIDYRADDFTVLPERFDLVLDLFGTRSARSVLRVLAPGGRYMFVGGPVPVLLNLVIVGAILALGSDRKAGLLIVEQGPRRLVELMTMVADGRLRPVVGEVAQLAEAARALGRMGSRRDRRQARRCALTHRTRCLPSYGEALEFIVDVCRPRPARQGSSGPRTV